MYVSLSFVHKVGSNSQRQLKCIQMNSEKGNIAAGNRHLHCEDMVKLRQEEKKWKM